MVGFTFLREPQVVTFSSEVNKVFSFRGYMDIMETGLRFVIIEEFTFDPLCANCSVPLI